jgi:hypothetical protein
MVNVGNLQVRKNKVYCFDPKHQSPRLMGYIDSDGKTFVKTVEPKNYMRVIGGYGLQYDAFSSFAEAGLTKIVVFEKHTGNSWLSTTKDWVEHGKIADYGNGKQVFLSLKYMHVQLKGGE